MSQPQEHADEKHASIADAPKPERKEYRWALGAKVGNGPVYPGSDRRGSGAGEVIGLQVGEYTLSTGGGGALLDFGQDPRQSGITAQFLRWDAIRVSGTLRVDSGRDGSDDEVLRGLPKVRRTLRGQASLIYEPSTAFAMRTSLIQDLLNRGGGSVLNTSVRYIHRVSRTTEVSAGASFNLANRTHMQSYYGVPVSAAGVTTPLPAFEAKGGLMSQDVSVGFKTALRERWILFGGLTYTQLKGDARRSPLTFKPDYYGVSVGLAYRH